MSERGEQQWLAPARDPRHLPSCAIGEQNANTARRPLHIPGSIAGCTSRIAATEPNANGSPYQACPALREENRKKTKMSANSPPLYAITVAASGVIDVCLLHRRVRDHCWAAWLMLYAEGRETVPKAMRDPLDCTP
jgi:hypothetical protein